MCSCARGGGGGARAECPCTLDGHEDKIWALDVAAGEAGLEIWSGSADAVMVRWRDSTQAVAEESAAARDSRMESEQELANALFAQQFDVALGHALKLRQPRALRTVVEKLVPDARGGEILGEAVARLPADDVAHCLECARDWNTTAQHSQTAHRLLHAIFSAVPMSELLTTPRLQTAVEALLPYTQRHSDRLDRLQQSSHFLGYILAEMDVIHADADASAVDAETGEGSAASSQRPPVKRLRA